MLGGVIMQEYMRVCNVCENENDRSLFTGKLYVPGWFDFWDCEPPENTMCDFHSNEVLIKKVMTCEEFQILRQISNEPSFMEAMNDLKEKDPIEYQLKLSQFKTQVEQQNANKQQTSNQVHCPKCKSTSITTGARGVNQFWGLLGASKTVNRCANCGYTWKP
jgi:DNA-directed RNA polymerase subunit M/transcription elongation factor TFIIS